MKRSIIIHTILGRVAYRHIVDRADLAIDDQSTDDQSTDETVRQACLTYVCQAIGVDRDMFRTCIVEVLRDRSPWLVIIRS